MRDRLSSVAPKKPVPVHLTAHVCKMPKPICMNLTKQSYAYFVVLSKRVDQMNFQHCHKQRGATWRKSQQP